MFGQQAFDVECRQFLTGFVALKSRGQVVVATQHTCERTQIRNGHSKAIRHVLADQPFRCLAQGFCRLPDSFGEFGEARFCGICTCFDLVE